MREILAEAGMADDLFDEKYQGAAYRAQPGPATHIQELYEAFTATHTAEELLHTVPRRVLT